MELDSRIYVAGHTGLVGSSIVEALRKQGYKNILTSSTIFTDLRDKNSVNSWFAIHRPEYVFLAAARVGGIFDNINNPSQFIYDNLMIQSNIVDAAHKNFVKKLMFFASSCIFPKDSKQPMKEEYLGTGPLEPTNEYYSIAKIAGIKLCEAYNKSYGTNFFSVNPCNIYGEREKFDLEKSHVLASLAMKFVNAKKNKEPYVTCFGTGEAMREFMHSDDLAEACIYLMNTYEDKDMINIGAGKDITIKELANKIKDIVKYDGEIVWDTSKPNGMMRKLLDNTRMKNLGWEPKITLDEGIGRIVSYLENKNA